MDALPDEATLITIDVQRGLDDPVVGRRNNSGAEENRAKLLEGWLRTGRPVFHG